MKLSNISHPLQAARKTKAWLKTSVHMWRFGAHGRRHFLGDPRYNLRSVTEGFAPQGDISKNDRQLLERICTAYKAATQQSEDSGYEFSDTWNQLRQTGLKPYIQALLEKDYVALGKMYRNFYRDSCSSGLLAAPGGRAKAYFGGRIRDIYRRFYLSHVLYRLDYWKQLTDDSYSLKVLAGPGIGNPFGVVMEGTHIAIGSEYAHYCALRISSLIDRSNDSHAVVGELGGGYGAIAYYLLRDHQPLTYVDFDTPERVALSSYYLMKAFPDRKFLLYGEKELSHETISQADVVLMPISALAEMPAGSIDIAFNSHSRSTLTQESMNKCLLKVASLATHSLLYLGNRNASELIAETLTSGNGGFSLMDKRTSGWHSHKVSGAGVGGAAGLASSTLFEQSFTRRIDIEERISVSGDSRSVAPSLTFEEGAPARPPENGHYATPVPGRSYAE